MTYLLLMFLAFIEWMHIYWIKLQTHCIRKKKWLERYCHSEILYVCSWKSFSIHSSLLPYRMAPGLFTKHLLLCFQKTSSKRKCTTHWFQVFVSFFCCCGFLSLTHDLNFPFCHLILVLLWVNTEQKTLLNKQSFHLEC